MVGGPGEKRIEESMAEHHWATWAKSWNVERRHLQGQINRDRENEKARKENKAALARRRRERIEMGWSVDSGVASSHSKSQGDRAAQDTVIRKAEDANSETNRTLHHEAKTTLTVSARAHVETRVGAADVLSARHGEEHWKSLMQRGAKVYELEQRQNKDKRERAIRGYKWAKEDESHDLKTDETGGTTRTSPTRLVSTRLPTSKAPSGHSQSPGAWRTSQQNMVPGAWKNNQVDEEMIRAKTASWLEHRSSVNKYNARNSVRSACLDNWSANLASVSDATYSAWRLKVDAMSPARGGLGADGPPLSHATSFWPSKTTHRISPPPSPVPPRSSRGLGLPSPRSPL